jgi:hypothetical protein
MVISAVFPPRPLTPNFSMADDAGFEAPRPDAAGEELGLIFPCRRKGAETM